MAAPTIDSREEIAQRLAKKSGLAKEQAEAFVDALLALVAEEQASSSFVGLLLSAVVEKPVFQHVMTIPLTTDEDGTVKVHPSQPIRFDRGLHTLPLPSPPSPGKPGRPPIFAARPPIFFSDVGRGRYAGHKPASPYAKVVIHNGLHDFDLSKLDLTDLPEAMNKVNLASKAAPVPPGKTRIGKPKKEL